MTMQITDKATAKEWFQLIEDGVPEDLAELWLEREATGSEAPKGYGDSWRTASRPDRLKARGLNTGVSEDLAKLRLEREATGRETPQGYGDSLRAASRAHSANAKGLSKAEYLVLRMYTMDKYKFYKQFNADCRERKWKSYKVYTSLLQSGLSKLRRKSSEDVLTLYKGLSRNSPDATTNEVCMPCFTSTTKSLATAKTFGSNVLVVESRTAAEIQDISQFCEQETLFSPFQVFVALGDKSSVNLQTCITDTLPFLLFPLFRGSLLGAVVGNCIGAPFEFKAASTIETLLTKLGLDEDNTAHKGSWHFTSDTSMILALADSLVRAHPLDIKDLRKSLSDAYMRDSNRNFGKSAAIVLKELHEQKPTDDPFAPAKKVCDGSGSYGNGGAMRIVPAALLNWNVLDENFKNAIGQITRLTHSHISGVNGAILQALAVQTAIRFSVYEERNQTIRERYLDQLIQKMQSVETSENRPYCDKLKAVKGFLSSEPSLETVQKDLGKGSTAETSVSTAIYCFLRGMQPIEGIPENRTEFERTIIYAISLGGDTDTIASMAGAIAGAYYGQDSIPQRWRDICETKAIEDAKRYAKQIHGLVFKT